MNGTLRITLRYTTRDGRDYISYDTTVSRAELEAADTAHRDPSSARFEAAYEALRLSTEGYTK